MPHLACWSCGRSVYTTSPIESLFFDERQCACGKLLQRERREHDRRRGARRGVAADRMAAMVDERRATDRRSIQRRSAVGAGGGWRS